MGNTGARVASGQGSFLHRLGFDSTELLFIIKVIRNRAELSLIKEEKQDQLNKIKKIESVANR